jgi:hypothetical protein
VPAHTQVAGDRRRCDRRGPHGRHAWTRARWVSTARGVIAALVSVHVFTAHAASVQRQRRLRHRSRTLRPNASTSRTTTVKRPLVNARTRMSGTTHGPPWSGSSARSRADQAPLQQDERVQSEQHSIDSTTLNTHLKPFARSLDNHES